MLERQITGSSEPSAGGSLHTNLVFLQVVHRPVQSVLILLLYILAKCA
jgi:hypothetical protein